MNKDVCISEDEFLNTIKETMEDLGFEQISEKAFRKTFIEEEQICIASRLS
jgi:hypothetical protein